MLFALIWKEWLKLRPAFLVLFATHFWLAREWMPLDPLAEKLVAIYVLAWIAAVSWYAWLRQP